MPEFHKLHCIIIIKCVHVHVHVNVQVQCTYETKESASDLGVCLKLIAAILTKSFHICCH